MGSLQVTNACESKRIVHSNNFALAIYSLEFNIVADAEIHEWVMPKRWLTKIPTENANILAFQLKKLTIAQSHKQSRKLTLEGLVWLQLGVQSACRQLN